MDFVQSQIDRGYTHLIITLRGVKGFKEIVEPFETVHIYNVDTVKKYNEVMDLYGSHRNGISVGWSLA